MFFGKDSYDKPFKMFGYWYSSVPFVLARIMMGFLYISSGIPKLVAFSVTVDKMSVGLLMLPSITAAAVVVIEVIGAIMIIMGFYSEDKVLSYVCIHRRSRYRSCFLSMPDVLTHDNMIHFIKNICISGRIPDVSDIGDVGSISFDKR